jgi:hypothetical protein
MTLNPITFIMCVVFGIANVCVCFQSLRFALTKTSSDPEKAVQDGPKTFGGRLAALFVGTFCGLAALFAAQMVFLGRLIWIYPDSLKSR